MILVFTTKAHSYTFNTYLQEWSAGLRCKMVLMGYEQLGQLTGTHPGTVLFSDVERLGAGQRIIADAFCTKVLEESGGKVKILNHPVRSCRRFELLTRLSDAGINSFRIHRLDALDDELRYPVFLRHANDHSGPTSKLLHNRQELMQAIIHVSMRTADFEELVITEFCDIRKSDGLYRKYSAFKIGDQILPGHMLFDKDWVQKDGLAGDDELRKEEEFYLKENPHQEQLQKIFEIADIQFGRIDYGELDGKLQVWEINTNPILFKRRSTYSERYIAKKDELAVQISDAFNEVDGMRVIDSQFDPMFHHQDPDLFSRLARAQHESVTKQPTGITKAATSL